MDCTTCKDNYKKTEPVPFIAYETAVESMRYTIKRLWILAILLALMLFGSNAAWIYYESQWQTVETTEVSQSVDTQDGSAYVAGIGDVYYGTNTADGTEDQIQK